jgi:hypothetical protein
VLTYPLPPDFPFRPYPFSEACDNPEKMLHNELIHAFDSSIACRDLLGDDLPCTIRANFGAVIVASLFSAEIEQVNNSPPWLRPFGFSDAFERILECDPRDFTKGLCPKLVETYEFYREALADFPILRKCIEVVLPGASTGFDNPKDVVT